MPVKPWQGVLQADHYGESSLQLGGNGSEGGEDCLTLNMMRPKDGKDLPVFV